MSWPKGRGVLAWALLSPHLALAQAHGATEGALALALQWNDEHRLAPTTQQDFERRLSERLGRPAFQPTATERELSVSWLGNQDSCRVQLHLVHGAQLEGSRLLTSPDGGCAAVLPALLTVSALLIESETAHERPDVAEPPPGAPAASAAPPEPLPVPVAPKLASSSPRFMLSLGGALLAGLSPRGELGPSASLLVLPTKALRTGVRVSGYLAREHGANPGLSLTHQSAALVVCTMPVASSFSLGLCGSGTLHRFGSRGLSLASPEQHHSYTWTAGVSGRGEWQLSKFFWWTAGAGPELAPRPLYFYYTRADARESTLFTQRRVSLSVWTGLTLGLP